MNDFINTIDLLGDIPTFKSIMEDTITEYRDDGLTALRSDAFGYCSKLTLIDLPVCTTIGGFAFRNCSKLQDVSLPSAKAIAGGAFVGCKALKTIILPSVETLLGANIFSSCTALKMVDLSSALQRVDSNTFPSCSALTSVILRRSDMVVPLQNTNAFTGTPIINGAGYVYVPRALVDIYKTATNWSTLASQFRALEDYTVDGTITGELDESKI